MPKRSRFVRCAIADEEHAGRRRHAERREVMLGDVIGVKAGPVERLDDFQPLLVIVAQRQIIAVEMIENAEFQRHAVPTHAMRALRTLFHR